jgi:hypothetical protein
MGNERQRIVVRESNASDGTFADITIQAKDLRPFILRRWSGTGISSIWSLEDRSFGAYYWRARSKEKLVAKAIKKLRRSALSLGIENPVINVTDPEAEVVSSGAGAVDRGRSAKPTWSTHEDNPELA